MDTLIFVVFSVVIFTPIIGLWDVKLNYNDFN